MDMKTLLEAAKRGANQVLTELGAEEAIFQWLGERTPEQAYRCIKENTELVSLLAPEVLQRMRVLVKKTPEWSGRVLSEGHILPRLRRRHPALYAVITTTPGGLEWARAELERFRLALT